MSKLPFVSILIVNYNGRQLLEECLTSLYTISYPKSRYEVIVVDNNSVDDSVPYVLKTFPTVKMVKSDVNLGFAGGNNLGLEHAIGEYIVLLNSDVRVDQDWLTALVSAAKNKKVGIVGSRLRYALPFIELTIDSVAVPKSKIFHTIDHSPIGVLIEDIVCDAAVAEHLVYYKSGFYEKRNGEICTRRTTGKAAVLLPYDFHKEKNTYVLTVHGLEATELDHMPLTISVEGMETVSLTLKAHETVQLHLHVDRSQIMPHWKWLIQNAGNTILSNGYGKDRGNVVVMNNTERQEFYEEESAYFEKKSKLLAACGASCLIKREVIDKVGFLDKTYFMYYEDVEFSLRAWRAGWDIIYEPASIGYHKHRATTGIDDSTFFLSHVERNHLGFVITHFPMQTVCREFYCFIARLGIAIVKFFVFQFMDNEARAHIWRVKYEGRKIAFQYLLANLFRLYNLRTVYNTKWPIDRTMMNKLMY